MVKAMTIQAALLPATAVGVLPALNRAVDAMLNSKLQHDSDPANDDYLVKGVHTTCWQRVKHYSHSSLVQNPGAGLGDVEPFDRVLKDGMTRIGCMKDAMYEHGDKFGPNKHDYKIGDSQNVSIVLYKDHVAKEDRKKMSPQVCFDFCRSVEEMNFFGILNGRDCYCMPYYQRLASDDGSCTSQREGDHTQICGSPGKSTIWEMHFCNDGAQQLAKAEVEAYSVLTLLADLVPRATSAANGKRDLAEDLQEKFGNAGDPAASAQMQLAKRSAGKLLHAAEEADKARMNLAQLIRDSYPFTGVHPDRLQYDGLPGENLLEIMKDVVPANRAAQFLDFNVAKRGESLTQELLSTTQSANQTYRDLSALYLLSEPEINAEFYVLVGQCFVDDSGCVQNRQDSDGKYFYGDYCFIQVRGGEAKIELERFDLGIHQYNWYGRHYAYPTAWIDMYNPHAEGGYTWHSYGGQAPAGYDENRIWWDSEQAFRNNHKTHAGFVEWWSYYYGSKQDGWKICAERKNDDNRRDQYYPAMYFVDKAYRDMPMTCTGTIIEQPIYYKNYEGCAAACDFRNQECVGFAYYPTRNNGPNLCFLFSDFTSGQYYTGCNTEFLQKRGSASLEQPLDSDVEPKHPVCVAKLSKFVGTSLKPKADGTCKNCFKELTHADRCWD
jgi:hypothetical protein